MVSTATGLIGALAAFVFAERVHATHQLRDFLIALALGMLSAADLILAAGPSLIDANPGHAWQWITLIARLSSQWRPDRRGLLSEGRPERSSPALPRRCVIASASALALIAGAMLVWHSHLPTLLGSAAWPSRAHRAGARGHLLLSYLQISGTLLAACAAVGLAGHSARERDGLERSIAAGVTVLAVARFNYFLVPSLQQRPALRRRHPEAGRVRADPVRMPARVPRRFSASWRSAWRSMSAGGWPATCTTASHRSSPSSPPTPSG